MFFLYTLLVILIIIAIGIFIGGLFIYKYFRKKDSIMVFSVPIIMYLKIKYLLMLGSFAIDFIMAINFVAV